MLVLEARGIGHMAAAKADPRQTQGGHMADKLRGRGHSVSRPAFFLERGFHSKLFGEKVGLGYSKFFRGRESIVAV